MYQRDLEEKKVFSDHFYTIQKFIEERDNNFFSKARRMDEGEQLGDLFKKMEDTTL